MGRSGIIQTLGSIGPSLLGHGRRSVGLMPPTRSVTIPPALVALALVTKVASVVILKTGRRNMAKIHIVTRAVFISIKRPALHWGSIFP